MWTAAIRSPQSRSAATGSPPATSRCPESSSSGDVGVLEQALDLRQSLDVGRRVVVEDRLVAAPRAPRPPRARTLSASTRQRASSSRSDASSPPRPGFATRSGPPASHSTGRAPVAPAASKRSSVWRSPAASSVVAVGLGEAHRHEAADELEPAGGEPLAQHVALAEVAGRAEVDAGVARGADRREHVAAARAPRSRCRRSSRRRRSSAARWRPSGSPRGLPGAATRAERSIASSTRAQASMSSTPGSPCSPSRTAARKCGPRARAGRRSPSARRPRAGRRRSRGAARRRGSSCSPRPAVVGELEALELVHPLELPGQRAARCRGPRSASARAGRRSPGSPPASRPCRRRARTARPPSPRCRRRRGRRSRRG